LNEGILKIQVCVFCGFNDLLLVDILQVVANVPLNALVEEDGFLADHSEGSSQMVKIVIPDVLSVQQNLSTDWSIEAKKEIEYCGFSASRIANYPHSLSFFYC
jgi:hypothetical protein